MSDAVLVALIGFGGTVFTATTAIITQIILNKRNRDKRKAESEEERRQAAIAEALKDERLEQRMKVIEDKLDIHNGYAEKLEDVNSQLIAIKTDIAVIKNDIQNLYHKGE
jgi:capsid portal protein